MERSHVKALDGLRGVAILSVLLFHAHVYGLAVPLSESAAQSLVGRLTNAVAWASWNFGWVGVDLFFLLSGFLITTSLYGSKQQPGALRRFFLRRALRIFPLYYAALILSAAGWYAFSPEGSSVLVDQAHPTLGLKWLVTYTQNFAISSVGWEAIPSFLNHTWSLAVEEQFYLVWPLVILYRPNQAHRWICAALILGALLFRVVWSAAGQEPLGNYVLLPARMDLLAAGGLIAVLAEAGGTPAKLRRGGTVVLLAGAATLALFLWIGRVHWTQDFFWVRKVTYASAWALQLKHAFPLLLGGGALAMLVASSGDSLLARALSIRPLCVLGKFSYGAYIVHLPLVLWLSIHHLSEAVGPTVSGYCLALGATLGASVLGGWVTYEGIERWFLAVKARLAPAHSTGRVIAVYISRNSSTETE